ncbi:hypothetical protein GCM10023231_11810 [Olivibacter ginsenosidimutans]|uniref:Glycosyltransferase 2-like domain-containing protein n=1 Tax=Olivibacter ginsenosidimutans TaxID=1176537 RepID=A0ABP9AT55_9SPHI
MSQERMAKVSVIIPCYNCEKFVSRAIESVLNQTCVDWEIILVNNNSTDKTLKILERYAVAYPSKVYVFEEPKRGAQAARNKGLGEAKGVWVQYLDADDEISTDKLERQVALAEENNADVVCGGYKTIQKLQSKLIKIKSIYYKFQDKNKSITANNILETIRLPKVDIWKGLISSQLGITSANLWSKRALESVNGWDEQLTSAQEYDLLFRIMKNNGRIIIDPNLCAKIYKQENSISASTDFDKKEEIINNSINLRFRIRDYLFSKGKLTAELDNYIDHWIYSYLMSFRSIMPGRISTKLKNMKLRISVKTIIRSNILYFFKKTVKTFN